MEYWNNERVLASLILDSLSFGARPDSITGALLLDSETDSFWGRCGRGKQERLEMLIEVDNGGVMRQECLLDLRQTFGISDISHELFTHADKGTRNKDAHFNGTVTIEHRSYHNNAMLCECIREILAMLSSFRFVFVSL